jgi:hypothetical protein
VLCHFPLLEAASSIRHLLWDKEQVLSVLHEHNDTVVAWMNGHYHQGGYAFHDRIHHITFEVGLRVWLPRVAQSIPLAVFPLTS